jgi:hypothetical protein
MPDRITLTKHYLEEVARSGVTGKDLVSVITPTGLQAGPQFLSRPLFIGHDEAQQLNADLQHIWTALVSLPNRLYDGDLVAFGRAVGMTDGQVSAVVRSRTGQVSQLSRPDMYAEADGLRLLEFNIGSAVNGLTISDVCRQMLRHPLLKEFARTHQLHYPDTLRQHFDLIFAETGFARDSHPVVAVADWPERYPRIKRTLQTVARRWRAMGLDAHACHIGQLTMSNGRVWLRGRPVDIIFRIFLAEHLLTPEGHTLMDPVLDAVARGQVVLFTPLDSEMFGSKMPLAMLSDHANRDLFSPAEQAAIDRVLPWTRMVRPGPVTLEDGQTVDLYDYALSHASELVLKPALLHGGKGVLPGWSTQTTPELWRDQLASAMDGPYVLQRRIHPEPELCPSEEGQTIPWVVTWGVFSFPTGYGGVYARAHPTDSPHQITTAGPHLSLGCGLTGGPGTAGARLAAEEPVDRS